MKIRDISPPPPPREVQMTFPVSEGWAIVAAIRDYARAHPGAQHADDWRRWANTLDDQLRGRAS